MRFEGVVESFSRTTVKGWVSCTSEGKPLVPNLRLQFRSHDPISPSVMIDRGDKSGFVFRLPEKFDAIKWHDFIQDFDAVVAWHPADPNVTRWRVPLHKSILAPLDPDNRTGLVGARLREYRIAPNHDGRIAAFTIAYNEPLMVPLWAKYYAQVFGAENLYVIDQGSDKPYDTALPPGVNVVRLPRDTFDNWLIARTVAMFQRFLLESYETIVYSDSDEFICSDPQALGGRSLAEHLKLLPVPVGITTGFNLVHDLANEAGYDPTVPLLSQRRLLHREPTMDKPMVSRIPLNWVPGFHSAAEGGANIPGLYMLHLRWFDLDQALIKGGRYRNSKWNAFDLERNLAAYQREGEQQIIARFRSLTALVSGLRGAEFDPAAAFTVVPAWMRAAIGI